MKKPRMETRAQVEWLLRYHVEERDKAIAKRDAAKVGSGEYAYAEHNCTWHSGAAAVLAIVLGIEGDLEAISTHFRKANPEDHEQ